MNASRRTSLSIAAGVLLLVPSVAAAQGRNPVVIQRAPEPGLGWLTVPIDVDPIVTNAPYSADAVTTVTQLLGDGTKIERSVTAKVFRDGMGRVRREQTVIGLASLTPAQDGQRTITISDPVERVTITLDERAKIARRAPMVGWMIRQLNNVKSGVFFRLQSDDAAVFTRRLPTPLGDAVPGDVLNQLQGGRTGRSTQPSPAPAGPATSLGTRTIEGVLVTGKRTTQTIPAGQIGNDRPIVISDEVWESDVLKAVVVSKHTDPRTGTVDYKLTNIRLGEPSADLFTIPPGYTITGNGPAALVAPIAPGLAPASPTAPPQPAPPSGRGGGRGRGQQQ